MAQSQLAIVVPMLNEAANLPALLAHLQPYQQSGCEIVLVDGGSQDSSVEIARCAGFCVIASAAGRARQMNAGAQATQADVLLFLHADTRLPEAADTLILQALAHPKKQWGRFDVSISGQAAMLRVVAVMMNWRSRLSGIATGDQALFMRRSAFDAVGGFADQPLMEDIDICTALKKISLPACLRERVQTSGRRWETRGVGRTILLMWRLRWDYWRGASAAEIARRYR